jgi:hypothetical protein
LPILVVETGSEGFVGGTGDPAVQGDVLPRVVGIAEQFRAEVAVGLAEQQGPIPGGAVGVLEFALPAYEGPEPPGYYVRGQMVISSEYLSSSPREVHACEENDRADYPPHSGEGLRHITTHVSTFRIIPPTRFRTTLEYRGAPTGRKGRGSTSRPFHCKVVRGARSMTPERPPSVSSRRADRTRATPPPSCRSRRSGLSGCRSSRSGFPLAPPRRTRPGGCL